MTKPLHVVNLMCPPQTLEACSSTTGYYIKLSIYINEVIISIYKSKFKDKLKEKHNYYIRVKRINILMWHFICNKI